MSQWEEIDDDDSPFAGVEKVDGIVYQDNTEDVELRVSHGKMPHIPPPPVRTAPQRPVLQSTGPWEPLKVDPKTFQKGPAQHNPAKIMLLGMLPLVVVFVVLMVVLQLFGFKN